MYIDAETNEELQYLYALGATDSVLSTLALDDDHENFVVCPQPFIALQDSTDKTIVVPVEFGGNIVNFILRQSLNESSWWITEEGSVSNEEIHTVQRFLLNAFKHRANNWTYMIVSPYPYSEDLSDTLKRQCIANSSLLIKY